MATEGKTRDGPSMTPEEKYASELLDTAAKKKNKKPKKKKKTDHETNVQKFLRDFFELGKPKKKTKKTSPGLPGLYWRGVEDSPFSYQPGGDGGGDGGGGGNGGSAASVAETEEELMRQLRKKMDLKGKKAGGENPYVGWDNLPKGWTKESVEKFWGSLTGDHEHKFTECRKKMEGNVDDPDAFCASLKDMMKGTEEWRGKGKGAASTSSRPYSADSLDEMGFDPGRAQNEFRQETGPVEEAIQIEETPPTEVDPEEVEPVDMEDVSANPPQRADMASGEETQNVPDGPEAMEDPQMQIHKGTEEIFEVDPSMVEELNVAVDLEVGEDDEDDYASPVPSEGDEMEAVEDEEDDLLGDEEIPEVSDEEVEYELEMEAPEEDLGEMEEEDELEEACGSRGDRAKLYNSEQPVLVKEDDVEVVDEGRGHAGATPDSPPTTLEPEDAEAPTLPQSDIKVPAIDPAEKESTDVVYEVVVPASSLTDESIDRIELARYGENSDDPMYIVLLDGDPVAKIALSDQNLPDEHRETFLDDNYPNFVLEGMEQFGVQATLKTVNARFYAARANEGEVAESVKARVASEMHEARQVEIGRLKDDLLNVASVVLQGTMKNYLLDNPLRDALISRFHRAGVDPSAAVDEIDDAFRSAGQDFFNTVLETADEWLGLPKEALEHHVQKIQEMSHRHPGYDMVQGYNEDDIPEAVEPTPEPRQYAAQAAAPAPSVPKNVPLRSAAPRAPSGGGFKQDKEYWKRQLNLSGRVANASLAQYQLRNPKQ